MISIFNVVQRALLPVCDTTDVYIVKELKWCSIAADQLSRKSQGIQIRAEKTHLNVLVKTFSCSWSAEEDTMLTITSLNRLVSK